MTYDYNETNRRAGKYVFALLFILFVPGLFLSAFIRFQPMILPKAVVNFLFPWALLPIEKTIASAMSYQFDQVNLDSGVFDHIGVFSQQIFVIALLCFFLVPVIVALQARAGALYAEWPMPTLVALFVFVTTILMGIFARSFFSYLLITNLHKSSELPTVIVVSYLLNALAPEGLIMFTCIIAVGMIRIFKSAYDFFA